MRPIKLAHIINPVNLPADTSLGQAQPITVASMTAARAFAEDTVAIQFYSAQYPEDRGTLPPAFAPTPNLVRSALEVANFQQQRKLPLLRDILDRLYEEATEATHLIYTNVDIALMPHFYVAVARYIEHGHDAFVINRRTIPNRYSGPRDLPLMYADLGQPHRGWDCFVFRRDHYPRYRLGKTLVGVPRVGLVLIANLVAHAENFHEFREEHLTFHLGNDRRWGGSALADYAEHNTQEALRILGELEEACGPFPRSSPPGAFLFKRRLLAPLYERWVRSVHLPVRIPRFFQRVWRRIAKGN